ncbi:MAG: hypothetical protein CM15mP62_31880 [Rhodospirillaceae bacterium]|nr:MAG: hypothetical protein CM15mP62_31880 [Rhodospirillaceae bacterium]
MRKQLTSKKLPTFWVDTFDQIELERLKNLKLVSIQLYTNTGQTDRVYCMGFSHTGLIPPVMRQMMLGENIYIRYWTLMGDEDWREIPLARANEAIAQFLKSTTT